MARKARPAGGAAAARAVVPTPIRPPGTANCSAFCSANSDTMRE